MNVYFVVAPHTHLLDLSGPAHMFYEAQQYVADIELVFVSIFSDTRVKSSAGLYFEKLVPYSTIKLEKSDLIFIAGCDQKLLFKNNFTQKNNNFFNWLKHASKTVNLICSSCTGAYLLAEAQLLDNKNCTTHWKHFDDFRRRYPKSRLQENRLFVQDGNIYTSAGVSSGIDLALFVIGKLFGYKLLNKVTKESVIYLRRTNEDPQLSIFVNFRNHINQRIHTAQDLILNRISDSPTIKEIAESIAMSERNLTRLFKKVTGITISRYTQLIRLELANKLQNEEKTADYIVQQLGYKSIKQLNKLLKEKNSNGKMAEF